MSAEEIVMAYSPLPVLEIKLSVIRVSYKSY